MKKIYSTHALSRAMKLAGHLATYDEGTLPPGEKDYLDALTVFIEDYQRRHPVELPEVTPLAMIKHLMEERDMHITDLRCAVGSQSNMSLIFSGKRAISKRVMELLSQHFGVPPSVFL